MIGIENYLDPFIYAPIKKKASNAHYTVSGNPISISNGYPVNAKGLSVALEPIQDLHGYSNPWPAGGGKNLLDPDKRITYDSGKGIRWYYSDGFTLKANQTYTMAKSSGSQSIRVYIVDKSSGTTIVDGNPSVSYTPSVDTVVYLQAYRSEVITDDNLFQLEMGSSATTWQPYSNICPISGHTDVSVVRSGNNIWDEEWELGVYSSSSGNPVSGSTSIRSKSTNYISVFPSATYYFKTAGKIMEVYQYRADKSYIAKFNVTDNIQTLHTECNYIRFDVGASYGTTYNNDIAINYPSTVTSYSPHNIVNISIPLGQTVYGGTVDVVEGVLTIEYVKKTISSFDGTWGALTYGYGYYALDAETTHDITLVNPTYMKSNIFPYSANSRNSQPLFTYGGNAGASQTQTFILPSTVTTLADANTWLTNNLAECTFRLATPITVTLTPQDLMMLLGDNVITSDGTITLDYYCDVTKYIAKKIAEVQALILS